MRISSSLHVVVAVACMVCVMVCGGAAGAAAASGGSVRMVVAYCPTLFTSAGAVVDVDVSSGKATVVGKFEWPDDAMEGCVADYDPTVATGKDDASVWFNFVADDGVFVQVDLAKAEVAAHFSVGDPFFTGFEAFGEFGAGLTGVSGTVTENGPCDNGCFEYGATTEKGKYSKAALILFKEIADDIYYTDGSNFYIQAGYDLRDTKCAPVDSDECLLKLDITTGALLAATYTNYTIYGIRGLAVDHDAAPDAGPVIQTWMAGFADQCPSQDSPNPGFAFGSVNLATAEATLGACLSANVTIDMDEWVGAFSDDGAYFATGSGNAYGDPAQLVVLDTATGKPVINSHLASLPATLGAAQNLIWVWSVSWL